MSWSQDQIDSTLRKIVERSLKDSAFRALAIRDGRAAVNAVSSAPLPENFKVRFVDNAGADLTIVLPDPAPAQEIREEELAGVAGGAYGPTLTCAGVCHTIPPACPPPPVPTQSNLTACNPSYTKKPGNPTFCP